MLVFSAVYTCVHAASCVEMTKMNTCAHETVVCNVWGKLGRRYVAVTVLHNNHFSRAKNDYYVTQSPREL